MCIASKVLSFSWKYRCFLWRDEKLFRPSVYLNNSHRTSHLSEVTPLYCMYWERELMCHKLYPRAAKWQAIKLLREIERPSVIKCVNESVHGFLDSSVSCLVSIAKAIECLRVFWFSHHSLRNKAEVRYDVILQKLNIQSALKQHNPGMAANMPSLWIQNDCKGYLYSSHLIPLI